MIRFACEHCGKVIQVKPELAGRKGKCPGCQAVLVIPAASESGPPAPQQPAAPAGPPQRKSPPVADPFAASAPQAPDDFSSFDPGISTSGTGNPYSSPRGKKSRSNDDTGLPLGLGIGSLVLGVLSLFFTCCLWFVQLPFAAIGLGLGIFGLTKSKGLKGAPRVLPILGTIFSAIGLVLSIATLILFIIGSQVSDGFREDLEKKIEEMEREQKSQQEMNFDFQNSEEE